jgi:hypothetical protein
MCLTLKVVLIDTAVKYIIYLSNASVLALRHGPRDHPLSIDVRLVTLGCTPVCPWVESWLFLGNNPWGDVSACPWICGSSLLWKDFLPRKTVYTGRGTLE